MEMVLRCVSVDLIASCGRCSCSCNVWSIGMWMVLLPHVVRMMIGRTFQSLLRIPFRTGGVFDCFSLDSFFCKLVIGICKFYEIYFDVWIWMEWWSAIVWNTLNTKYVRFETGIRLLRLCNA